MGFRLKKVIKVEGRKVFLLLLLQSQNCKIKIIIKLIIKILGFFWSFFGDFLLSFFFKEKMLPYKSFRISLKYSNNMKHDSQKL